MNEPKNDLTIAEMQRAAHQTAKDKGFWEPPSKREMEFASAVTLIHHYLSEALEANRKGLGVQQRANLTDAKITLDDLIDFGPNAALGDVPASIELTKLALIHSEVSEAAEPRLFGGEDNTGEELGDGVIRIGDLAGGLGVDLEEEIAAKMAKNLDRPHMHGKRY